MSTETGEAAYGAAPQADAEPRPPVASAEVADTIYIGKKRLNVYETTILVQLRNFKKVRIKARGFNICPAVDVAERVKRKTQNTGISVEKITLGSVPLESKDGKKRHISTIEIVISKAAQ